MKILAFLQNQWFKNPQLARRMFARKPELRNEYIRRFLFAGCVTGKRLQSAFGVDLCHQIVWEETSKEIGGHSDSVFKADIHHMEAAIKQYDPDVILGFGKVACDALRKLNWGLRPALLGKIIAGPHPASRQNAMAGLIEMKADLIRRMSPAQ